MRPAAQQKELLTKMNEEILEAARELAESLQSDIVYAANRVEHIRVSRRANEAAHLLEKIERVLDNGTPKE